MATCFLWKRLAQQQANSPLLRQALANGSGVTGQDFSG